MPFLYNSTLQSFCFLKLYLVLQLVCFFIIIGFKTEYQLRRFKKNMTLKIKRAQYNIELTVYFLLYPKKPKCPI